MLAANCADRFDVLHRHGLAAAGVIGHGQHNQGHALAAHFLDQSFQRGDVHVAFERMLQAGLAPRGDDQVDRFGADKLHVGAGGVKVRVVGHNIALLAHHAEQNALGRAALVRRDDMLVAENILHRRAKLLEAAAAGITLIAFHHSRPLVGGHGAGAGIGKQVNQNIVGGQQKEVVERRAQRLLPLGASRPVNRLDAFDAKGFDDGAWHMGFSFLPHTLRLRVSVTGITDAREPGSEFVRGVGHSHPLDTFAARIWRTGVSAPRNQTLTESRRSAGT